MITIKEGIEIIDLGEEDGIVLYDSQTGDTSVLDSVAADIFNLFSKHSHKEEVIKELTEIYDAPVDVIRADSEKFIEDLIDKGLLVQKED